MKIMNATSFRHYFHSEESTRTTIRETLGPVLLSERLDAFMAALAEAYADEGIEQAGQWYTAALDEIRHYAPSTPHASGTNALHERLSTNDTTKKVLQHCASQEQVALHVGVVRQLIAAGVPVDLKLDANEFTALHWAASNSKPPMVDALLSCGADLEACGEGASRVTPLLRAIGLNDGSMLKHLIGKGADVLATTGSGMDALLVAISAGWTEDVLQAIVDAGANVHAHRGTGDCPMTLAAKKNQDVAIRYLVSVGADPNATDANGKQPALLMALYEGHGNAVRALLEGGANPRPLQGIELENHLMPRDVEFVRSFITEYEVVHAIDIPNAGECVHNDHEVPIFPRGNSLPKLSPL